MSATKRHAEALADQHRLYAIAGKDERFYYRNAVLDCCQALLKACEGSDLETRYGLLHSVDVLHAVFDDLKAVDVWQPADR